MLLVRTGSAQALGLIGLLILPLLGIWIAMANLRYGVRVQRLTRRLAAENALPDVSGPGRRPSGRIEYAAADAWFDRRQAELDAQPTDWRCWYRLAHAYDVAGDRRRAREAMRQALRLAGTVSARGGGSRVASA
jgi:tetratricopeptide (TPR) repeat protein